MKLNIKSKTGFTLIELLVVIGILAIITAIAIPSIAGIINKSRESADKTKVNTMENAIQEFATSYKMYPSVYETQKDDKIDNIILKISEKDTIDNYRKTFEELETSGKINKLGYPATALGIITIINTYSTDNGTEVTVPASEGKSFYYNVESGCIIKEKEGITSATLLATKLEDITLDASGETTNNYVTWIDLTTTIGRKENGIDNRVADANYVMNYAGADGGSVSYELSQCCYITADGLIGIYDEYKDKLPETVTLPAYFDDTKIVGLKDSAFWGVTGVKTLNIPEGMKSIGKNAFYTSSIENLNISSTISDISEYAFTNANKLKNIVVNENNPYITSVDNIIYSKDKKNIFLQGIQSNTYKIPDGITTINSISGYKNINELIIGKDVSVIGNNVIRILGEIKNVTVDKNNKDFIIEDGILYTYNKKSIVKILANNDNNSTFVIKDGVTSLKAFSTEYAKYIEKLVIPASVTNIDQAAIFELTNLKEIIVDSNNAYFTSVDGVLYNKNKTSLLCWPSQKQYDSSLLFDSLSYYSYRCFYDVKTMPSTFTFGTNITDFDSQAFLGSSVTELVTNDKLNKISTNGCTEIIKITITNPNTTIGTFLNISTNGLTVIAPNGLNNNVIENGLVFNKNKTILLTTLQNSGDIVIPNTVTELNRYAIYSRKLNSIYIPKSVVKINETTFIGSTIQKIYFESSKDEIQGAFWGLYNNPTVEYNVKR